MRKINTNQVAIGIDTGTNTAFAVWDGNHEKMIELRSTIKDQATRELNQLINEYEPRLVAIGIEVPSNKKVYDRPGQNYRAMKKIAHNVGECYGAGQALVGFCEALLLNGAKWRLYKLRPKLTKMDRRSFEIYCGWPAKKSSNEHTRDAGVMAVRTFDNWIFDQRVGE